MRSASPSLFLATASTILLLIAFLLLSPDCRHWFVIPASICGVLIGRDAAPLVFGKLKFYDPQALLGALGYHFFFLAPLLHVHWNHWLPYVQPLDDWRYWLGIMAALNAVCIIIYQTVRGVVLNSSSSSEVDPRRQVSNLLLLTLTSALVPILCGLQLHIYRSYGGVAGYMQTFTDRANGFDGLGVLFALSESLPIILAFRVFLTRRPGYEEVSWLRISLLLAGFFVLQLLFGGLRGSRSNTIYRLFWVTGLVDGCVRPIPRKLLICGIFLSMAFLYLYGFYKAGGLDVFYLLENGFAVAEEDTRRTLGGALLGDLARADVQAVLLHNQTNATSQYGYAYGRTYLGAVCIMIPKSLWPNRPLTKVYEGTEMLFGDGAWAAGLKASNVYGLAGEAMLNFGPFGPIVAFALLGAFVGNASLLARRPFGDKVAHAVAPFLALMSIIILTADSDNLVFFAFSFGALPLSVIALCTIPTARKRINS